MWASLRLPLSCICQHQPLLRLIYQSCTCVHLSTTWMTRLLFFLPFLELGLKFRFLVGLGLMTNFPILLTDSLSLRAKSSCLTSWLTRLPCKEGVALGSNLGLKWKQPQHFFWHKILIVWTLDHDTSYRYGRLLLQWTSRLALTAVSSNFALWRARYVFDCLDEWPKEPRVRSLPRTWWSI